ncbi:hypothetical protein FRC09_011953, partial [Ceratobasidium sp. 395]
LKWKTGDMTWEPYRVVKHLEALNAYCEAQGVSNIGNLKMGLDDVEGSEPEDYELNCLGLIITGDEDNKRKGKNDLPYPSPPTNPLSSTHTTHTQTADMNGDDVYLRSLQMIFDNQTRVLENQAKSQAATNDAMIRMAQTMGRGNEGRGRGGGGRGRGGRGWKKSHRQREAKAKEAIRDPRRKERDQSEQKQGESSGYSHTTHPTNDLLSLPHDWTNAGFETTNGAQTLNHDLLTGGQDGPNPLLSMPVVLPVPAYSSPNNSLPSLPSHSTHTSTASHITTPRSAPARSTQPTPTHVVTILPEAQGQEDPSHVAPATNPEEGHEEAIDYDDETMEDAGATEGH